MLLAQLYTEVKPISMGNVEHRTSCMTTDHHLLPDYLSTYAQITTLLPICVHVLSVYKQTLLMGSLLIQWLTSCALLCVRFSKMSGSVADTSIVLPSPSLRRRQSCYSNYSDVGILPSVRLMQSDTRPVLSDHNSRMVGADNIRVRVAPPDPIRAINTW